MAPNPRFEERAATQATRALLTLGGIQAVSMALYFVLARGVPDLGEGISIVVGVGYPFVFAGLVSQRIAVRLSFRLATLFASTLGATPSPELTNLGEWIARMDATPSVAGDLADGDRAGQGRDIVGGTTDSIL